VALGLGLLQIVLDKGQRADWFASSYIVWCAVIAGAALAFLVFWEFRQADPVVDLRLLKDKSFLAANAVLFTVGFVLYSSTQLLPQLLQTQLGYTATLAGKVLTPGGFATMLMMPVVGFLVNKVQPRYLVGFGLLVEAAALYHMTHFNAQISYQQAMWARIFQAAGLGFLFVPINSVAYIGLPPGKRNHASALINLSRNMGGSFGISLAQTWLARRSQFHQVRLTEHLGPYDPNYHSTLHHLTHLFTGDNAAHGGSPALAILYQMVQRQAEMLAYLDLFWLLSMFALIMVSVVFLLRPRKMAELRAEV
jgi:DHA2 family multidrug resistance protein